jgi:hypothetical protein
LLYLRASVQAQAPQLAARVSQKPQPLVGDAAAPGDVQQGEGVAGVLGQGDQCGVTSLQNRPKFVRRRKKKKKEKTKKTKQFRAEKTSRFTKKRAISQAVQSAKRSKRQDGFKRTDWFGHAQELRKRSGDKLHKGAGTDSGGGRIYKLFEVQKDAEWFPNTDRFEV